jgi:hypothetical protein
MEAYTIPNQGRRERDVCIMQTIRKVFDFLVYISPFLQIVLAGLVAWFIGIQTVINRRQAALSELTTNFEFFMSMTRFVLTEREKTMSEFQREINEIISLAQHPPNGAPNEYLQQLHDRCVAAAKLYESSNEAFSKMESALDQAQRNITELTKKLDPVKYKKRKKESDNA